MATGAGIGGAEGAGWMTVVMFEVRQQHLHRRYPTPSRQMAALIMAAGEVKVQWDSCLPFWLRWSS